MDYIVEVTDFRGFVLERFETEDSNTAYHEYRILSDEYRDNSDIQVTLIEPEF